MWTLVHQIYVWIFNKYVQITQTKLDFLSKHIHNMGTNDLNLFWNVISGILLLVLR